MTNTRLGLHRPIALTAPQAIALAADAFHGPRSEVTALVEPHGTVLPIDSTHALVD